MSKKSVQSVKYGETLLEKDWKISTCEEKITYNFGKSSFHGMVEMEARHNRLRNEWR
jgi:hypothetical protein